MKNRLIKPLAAVVIALAALIGVAAPSLASTGGLVAAGGRAGANTVPWYNPSSAEKARITLVAERAVRSSSSTVSVNFHVANLSHMAGQTSTNNAYKYTMRVVYGAFTYRYYAYYAAGGWRTGSSKSWQVCNNGCRTVTSLWSAAVGLAVNYRANTVTVRFATKAFPASGKVTGFDADLYYNHKTAAAPAVSDPVAGAANFNIAKPVWYAFH